MTIRRPLDPHSEVIDKNRRWTPDWYSWIDDLAQGAAAPSLYRANPEQFGAKADNVTDDTAAIQAAFNSGASEVWFPGNYHCGQITVPNTCKMIRGPGRLTAITTFSSFGAMFLGTSNTDLTVDGLTLILASPTYDSNGALAFISPARLRIQNNHIEGGRFSVQLITSTTSVLIEKNFFFTPKQSAIDGTGISNVAMIIRENTIFAHATNTGHGIALGGLGFPGDRIHIIGNLIDGNVGASGFGINVLDCESAKIAHNSVRNTFAEAITCGGNSRHCEIADNTCFWSGGVGTDVAMSFEGNPGSSLFAMEYLVRDNVLVNSNAGGILLSDFSSDFLVQGNLICDCNRRFSLIGAPAGVYLIGSNSIRHAILNNVVTNIAGGGVNYCVAENGGVGTIPNFNYFANNYARGMITALTDIHGASSVQVNNVALP
jgi:parallel beta helix pectate lyase-like protein